LPETAEMSVVCRVRAPASTANLGAGFDCAAAALELWNELELTDAGDRPPPDADHLGVRAFSLLADPAPFGFSFVDRIPRERGLGSSASVIALGLAAAFFVRDEPLDPERLLALGVGLEGHADNLAAALAGGVCLTWDGRISRIADSPPAVPIAIVPEARQSTAESRAALPAAVPHADAAYTAARAALLGAALASGSTVLFGAALDDRLHEPYRSPFLAEVRASLPAGALGATLSGSGPTVIVWARREDAAACEDQVRKRFPTEHVTRLAISPRGAEAR